MRVISMIKRNLAGALTLLLGTGFIVSGVACAGSPQSKYTEMSADELAEHLIFEQKGFDLDEETQEGGTLRDRLKQDKIQKICSGLKGKQPDEATAKKVRQIAKSNMAYPEGGVEMGDWKKGEAIALNAFGYRVGHKYDDHSKKTPGGMCINCHVMDPEGDLPGGSLGPSLEKYGKQRGQDEAMVKYTYEMIYNPHVTFPCSKMPRLGANGFITKEQIRHVVAYLLDPASPVNK